MSAIVVRSDPPELRPAFCLLVAPAAVAVGAVGLARLGSTDSGLAGIDVIRFLVVAAWAVAGLVVGLRQRTDRVAPIALGIAGLGAWSLLADAQGWRDLSQLLLGTAVAGGLHLLLALPHGRLTTGGRRVSTALGYAAGAAVGLAAARADGSTPHWLWVTFIAAIAAGGVTAANPRYRATSGADRRRMQWVGWGITVWIETVLVAVALSFLADWPSEPTDVGVATSMLIPLALVAASDRRLLARVDHLLAGTVELTGLTALVVGCYVVVVVGLGRTPSGSERSLLVASMGAAAVAALLYLPARTRLADVANRLVYGERTAPDEALRTFGSRLTRAIPLDELLLQLAESLRKSMALASAEIWTGTDGRLDRTVGVPHRSAPGLHLGEKERNVVARAGVSGGTWIDVWMAGLAHERDAALLRVAPIAHAGELLGLIVLERRPGADPLSEEDDRVVVELARQVGLALHNAQLDGALQESLEELQRANDGLRESRLRIVSAGDAERRRLERDLHDGAQQHLVAMAVKLRLAEDLTEEDPDEAASVIGELRRDLQDAIAELRALAHGIFPPLLSSGGLNEALPAAASRAALPTVVDLDGVGRYPAEIEAAVYFCCLEAMQNAGKHAGDGSSIAVSVVRDADGLTFEVRDDGAGFVTDGAAVEGHGFVNMGDRLGAIGGRLTVTSAPGEGTTVRGDIPLAPDA